MKRLTKKKRKLTLKAEKAIIRDLAYAFEVFKEESVALGYSDLNF